MLTELYNNSTLVTSLRDNILDGNRQVDIPILAGSLPAVVAASLAQQLPDRNFLFVLRTKEDAYYFLNDLEALLGDNDLDSDHKQVLLFPTTYRRAYQTDNSDSANILMRSHVVKNLNSGRRTLVVSFPDALAELVVSPKTLTRNTLEIFKGGKLDMDFVIDVLEDYHFERVDFVVQPGQYAVRGGIIDVFSFASEHPFRIEFFDDSIDSLRSFDPVSQLSVRQFDKISIIPDFDDNINENEDENNDEDEKVSLLHYFNSTDILWPSSIPVHSAILELHHSITTVTIIPNSASDPVSSPQPAFNKRFDILRQTLSDYADHGYRLIITVTSNSQQKRLQKILDETADISNCQFSSINLSNGFIDHQEKNLCFTDHQLFDRYHKYTVRDLSDSRQALTLKELFELKPGDYVTHIDYGVGRFSGLEKIETNGHQQEVIRLVYKNNDTLYISIHGLHKISRYVGKEGTTPVLNRLGSNTWQLLKQRTKKHVKDIAKDLIALYAKRKAAHGFAFSPDSYLQNELEASFIYEDTPDQLKATIDVKSDMESSSPMDRLVCGDVGFGKTEVAIRAAFKAVCDSKQVALLVPSTILALQHFNTFSERLKNLPVNIEYLNRFRTTKEKNRIIADLAAGRIDILIGTHAITNSKIKFKDLGLLIIDEEQKFGVSVKEKIKQMRANVDVLTLTATPIPRTLQFSLMGARDLSIIQTPPPNRQPIQTELSTFSEDLIRDAILFELSRGGQVFFVSNRIENLPEMATLVNRLVPNAVVATAHGQMEGNLVEDTMMQFIQGDIDVLVSTAIVENGLDIPNANTIIVNNAQQFGLSDLHQMRGRVGRSNRKAFCYLLVPSFNALTDEAQKRLRAIEEFSNVGSGFNIAMRDLDIRGAGNILGAEQSGFISEIGYETYLKILNEALQELKMDFKLYENENHNENVNENHNENENKPILQHFNNPTINTSTLQPDCTIETDLEVLIPDSYVSNIGERLQLYKQLNDLSSDQQLDTFRQQLTDRFGPVPPPTEELILTIALRRIARNFFIEKLVLKQNKMVLHFPSNQNSPFYSSPLFTQLITYVQSHPRTVHLRETTDRLTLICDNITSIKGAISTLNLLVNSNQSL